MDDAKTRAAELPEELIGLVRQTTERSSTRTAARISPRCNPEEEYCRPAADRRA